MTKKNRMVELRQRLADIPNIILNEPMNQWDHDTIRAELVYSPMARVQTRITVLIELDKHSSEDYPLYELSVNFHAASGECVKLIDMREHHGIEKVIELSEVSELLQGMISAHDIMRSAIKGNCEDNVEMLKTYYIADRVTNRRNQHILKYQYFRGRTVCKAFISFTISKLVEDRVGNGRYTEDIVYRFNDDSISGDALSPYDSITALLGVLLVEVDRSIPMARRIMESHSKEIVGTDNDGS